MSEATPPPSHSEPVQRISVSLPVPLYRQFEEMMEERGFTNRSQVVAEMMQQQISDYYSLKGDHLMAGTITLLYDHKKPGLKQQLSEIQYAHISEVISSLQVLLENSHTMEVLLVQGRAKTLRRIASELLACKGVLSGRFNLSRIVLPPIHTVQPPAEPPAAGPSAS